MLQESAYTSTFPIPDEGCSANSSYWIRFKSDRSKTEPDGYIAK